MKTNLTQGNQSHRQSQRSALRSRLLPALLLGLTFLSVGTGRLSAQYNNNPNVNVTQKGGTVSGSYTFDLQGYTQISSIQMMVVTTSAGTPGPNSGVNYSTSANGWGHSDTMQWTVIDRLGVHGLDEADFAHDLGVMRQKLD